MLKAPAWSISDITEKERSYELPELHEHVVHVRLWHMSSFGVALLEVLKNLKISLCNPVRKTCGYGYDLLLTEDAPVDLLLQGSHGNRYDDLVLQVL